jgi:hypothetical protein
MLEHARGDVLAMGRNSAIKHFDATPEGQPMELAGSQHGRKPIVYELLRSPWLLRASDLLRREDTWATKRVEHPVEVVWDAERQRPAAFVREGRTWRIDALIQTWTVERSWWSPRRHISRHVWRVIARGGVYDLAFDRIRNAWFLSGIQD